MRVEQALLVGLRAAGYVTARFIVRCCIKFSNFGRRGLVIRTQKLIDAQFSVVQGALTLPRQCDATLELGQRLLKINLPRLERSNDRLEFGDRGFEFGQTAACRVIRRIISGRSGFSHAADYTIKAIVSCPGKTTGLT